MSHDDPMSTGAQLLLHTPQQDAQQIAEAFAEGEVGAIEAIRRLNGLLRNVDAVLRPLQEAREAIREAMLRPLLAAGGAVELHNEAIVTWVEPTITESYERAKVDHLISDLIAQGEPFATVAAQLAALKKTAPRSGFVKVERPRPTSAPSSEPPV